MLLLYRHREAQRSPQRRVKIMNTYEQYVAKLATKLTAFNVGNELENAVYEAVCGDSEVFEYINESYDWANSGFAVNGSKAQKESPNFADCTTLGEWDGYDLSDVQVLMQDVYNAALELKNA